MMMNVLSIKSSIFSDKGQSSQLLDQFIQSLRGDSTDIRVIERNLAQNPVPHLNDQAISAFMSSHTDDLNEQQKQAIALSDSLIDELKSADILLLGVPMYNFGPPSTLKSWIDYVARAGVTFRYTEKGPEGLISNVRKAYVLATRGGIYQGTLQDSQTQFIKDVLAFLGIVDVEFIYAEALNMGEQPSAIANAHDDINCKVREITETYK